MPIIVGTVRVAEEAGLPARPVLTSSGTGRYIGQMIPSSTWLPLVTLVAGGAFGVSTEWLRARWTSKRERTQRLEDREHDRTLRRSDFQRETLLDLQTALTAASRGSAALVVEDLKTFASTGKWAGSTHSKAASESLGTALRDVFVYNARVDDDGVREAVAKATSLIASAVTAKSAQDAVELDNQTHEAFRRANDAIGLVLRKLP